MTALTGKAPKDTYKDVLQVSNGNQGIDGTLRPVSDGGGTSCPLELSEDAVNIAAGFQVGGIPVSPAGRSMLTAVDFAAQRALLNAPLRLNANVKDYGAIGNGASHPLSSLLKADGTPLYPTLAAAQAKYPHALSLADEVDWCAIQAAINDTANFGIEVPKGNYLCNRTIVGKSNRFLRGVGTGIYQFGGTVITRTADVPLLTLTGVSIFVNPNFALLSRFSCRDILWDGNDNFGGGAPGSGAKWLAPIWDVAAAYECYFENVRWHNCAGSWIRAREWWDSRWVNCVFTFGGSQDGIYPGLDFLSGEKSPGYETCNNLYFYGPRFESCPGVILRASGNNGVDFWFTDFKAESVNYQLDYLMEFRGATGVHLSPAWLYGNGSTYAGMRYYATTAALHVGKGDYSFAITAGLPFNTAPQNAQLFTRMSMVMIDRDNPANYMSGRLKAYDPATGALTITSDYYAGSPAADVTSWEIAPAHPGLIYVGENTRLVKGTIIGGFSFAQNVPVDQPYVLTMVRLDNAENVDLHLGITEGSARLPATTFQAFKDATTTDNVNRGAFTFTIETGRTIGVNTILYIMGRTTNHRANWLIGRVTAYNPSTGQLDVYVDRIQYGGVPDDNVTGWTITPYLTALVLQTGPALEFGSNKRVRITGGSQAFGSPIAQQANSAMNEVEPIFVNGFGQDLIRMRSRRTVEEYGFRVLSDPTLVSDLDNPGQQVKANTGQFQFRFYDYERNKEYVPWAITGDRYFRLPMETIVERKLWFIDAAASTYKQASLVMAREAPPTTGTYAKGDIVLNSDPAQVGYLGWSCAGSPLNFMPFGRIVQQASLSDAATVNWNLAGQQSASITLAGNRALANPINMQAGEVYRLRVRQDATGGRTLAFGAAYKVPAEIAYALASAANAVTLLEFYCDGASLLLTNQKTYT